MPISSERGDAPLWCMRQNDSHGNPRPLRGITRSCATTFLRSSMLRSFDSHTSSPQQHVVVINTNMTTIIQTAPGFLLPSVQNTRTKKNRLFVPMLHTLAYDNLFIQLSYLPNVVQEEAASWHKSGKCITQNV